MKIKTNIVAVYAKHLDNRRLLGYAKGETKDIEAYFDDDKGYGLELESVEVVNIEAGYAESRTRLLDKRKRIQAELDELNRRLTR